MSAILVLLGLLSVATLASRRGYAAFVAHIVTTPILLAVGVAISPRALGLFTEATSEALLPAMRVGAAWLALLVGLRTSRPRMDRQWGKMMAATVSTNVLTWGVIAAAAFGVIVISPEYKFDLNAVEDSRRLTAIGAALLVGGLVAGTGLSFTREALYERKSEPATRLLLFVSRHDDIIAAIAVLAAIWLWPLNTEVAPIYEIPGVSVGVIVGLGATLAIAQLLTGDKTGGSQQSLIGVLGLLVFASGLSTTAVLPGAAIAFFFGSFLAFTGRGAQLLKALHKTERPVRLVVIILAGAHLGFAVWAIAVGVATAVARFIAKWAFALVAERKASSPIPMACVLGSSGLTIPFALSFALSRTEPLSSSHVLTAVCACVTVSDLATLILWRRKSRDEDSGRPEGEPVASGAKAAVESLKAEAAI
jgi:hypothetical protein